MTGTGHGALVGGVEAGGTTVTCAIGSGPDDVRAHVRFPTTEPATTLARALAFFRDHAGSAPVAAVGIATFGPVDLDPGSPAHGVITTTPKPGWAGTNPMTPFRERLGVPVVIDTDVNAAALAEHRWGAGRGLRSLVYVTIGTGIGGGAIVGGQRLHGLLHPEMGHVPLPHDRAADPYPGRCPYHGDCWEGLASGPALRERWGAPAESLPPGHPAWPLEARYIALGLAAIVGVLSPERIVLGGGVMEQPALLPLVRARLRETLGGYLRVPAILDAIDAYVVPPGLGRRAGVLGAIALARDAVARAAPRA